MCEDMNRLRASRPSEERARWGRRRTRRGCALHSPRGCVRISSRTRAHAEEARADETGRRGETSEGVEREASEPEKKKKKQKKEGQSASGRAQGAYSVVATCRGLRRIEGRGNEWSQAKE